MSVACHLQTLRLQRYSVFALPRFGDDIPEATRRLIHVADVSHFRPGDSHLEHLHLAKVLSVSGDADWSLPWVGPLSTLYLGGHYVAYHIPYLR